MEKLGAEGDLSSAAKDLATKTGKTLEVVSLIIYANEILRSDEDLMIIKIKASDKRSYNERIMKSLFYYLCVSVIKIWVDFYYMSIV